MQFPLLWMFKIPMMYLFQEHHTYQVGAIYAIISYMYDNFLPFSLVIPLCLLVISCHVSLVLNHS